MQYHAKKWFNNASVNAMATIAIGAMLIFSAAGMKAFGDNIQDDIESSPGSRTITAGGSTTVEYWIVANSASGSPAGCDAADGSSLTITLNVPSEVTVSPTSLSFNECQNGSDRNSQTAEYSSDTPGEYTITVSPSDTAGRYNTNPAAFTLIVEEDETPPPPTNTPPTITVPDDISVPATSASGDSVDFEVTATDTEDGDLTNSVICEDEGGQTVQSADTFPIGTTTVTCSVEDSGGLADEDSFDITVTIEATGFYQPVDNTPTVNSGKSGQTYPLKFEVFGDADDSSTEITETSVIQQPLQYKKINCGTGSTEDTLETAASGSTQLRYDSTAGQFIYNWKTPTTKGCYQVNINLIEGMDTLTANFNLR